MNPEQRLNDGNRQHFPEDVGVTKGGGIAGAEGMYDYVKPWPGGAEGPRESPRNLPSSSEMQKVKCITPIRCSGLLFSNWFNTISCLI